MIRTQRWQPDTCAAPGSADCCSFLETWDDALDPVARTHDFSAAERLCSFHAAMTGAAAFAQVYDENHRKNTVWRIALSVKPALLTAQFAWSYDASHVLTVNFGSALTNQQKNAVQSACDVQFGSGKVVVL